MFPHASAIYIVTVIRKVHVIISATVCQVVYINVHVVNSSKLLYLLRASLPLTADLAFEGTEVS